MKKFVLLMSTIVLMMGFMLAGNSCSKVDFVEDEGLAVGLKSAVVNTSANGHGTIVDWPAIGLKRQISFHAKVMPDGTVKGSGVLSCTSGELLSLFDITCMVVEGNMARFAGIITKHKANPGFEGQGCFFAVQDNGEGKKEGVFPDIVSLMWVGLPLPADCDAYLSVYGYPPAYYLEGGNIQVKP